MKHLELRVIEDAPAWMSDELKKAWVKGANNAIIIQNQISDDQELEREEILDVSPSG